MTEARGRRLRLTRADRAQLLEEMRKDFLKSRCTPEVWMLAAKMAVSEVLSRVVTLLEQPPPRGSAKSAGKRQEAELEQQARCEQRERGALPPSGKSGRFAL